MMSVCLGGPWGSGAVRYPTPSLASNALRGGFHLFSDLSVDFSGITVTAITAFPLLRPLLRAPGTKHPHPLPLATLCILDTSRPPKAALQPF